MQWADYSAGRPSGAALRAAGYGGVIRYVGLGSAGKRITAPEYIELTNAGIRVLLVAELGTADAWGSDNNPANAYARGKAYALMALNDARMLGIPDSVGIAAAADAHAVNQAQINCAVQYATGFRDVLGYQRAGFYGFFETLNAVHDANVVSWYWKCGTMPTMSEAKWVHFWQRNSAPTIRFVSGVQTDVNEEYNSIVGGSPVTPSPIPVSSAPIGDEDNMNVPPGTDDHVNILVKGKTELYVACSWNRKVTIHSLLFYGATGPDPQGTGVGGALENVTIDSNRPGPLPIPAKAVMATLRYTADHTYGIGVA